MPNRYSHIGALPQILMLLLLILILASVGLLWFDYLGLADAPGLVRSAMRLVGFDKAPPIEAPEDQLLLERLRLEKQLEAVELRVLELDQRAAELDELELKLEEERQALESKATELAERENSLNQRLSRYENRRAVLEQNVADLTSMRPDDAVAILAQYDDQLLIDTLRVTEELAQQSGELSLVSVWLSRLGADRAAEIQRKMTVKPTD